MIADLDCHILVDSLQIGYFKLRKGSVFTPVCHLSSG